MSSVQAPAEYELALTEAFDRAGRPDPKFFDKLLALPSISQLNHKYYRKLSAKDWLASAEGARDIEPCAFCHPKIKSHFVRYFGATAFNLHYMEVHARSNELLSKQPHVIEEAEKHIASVIAQSDKEISQYLSASEVLIADAGCEGHSARYGAPPLFVPAEIISPYCVLYLQLLMKADKLMSLLEYQKLRRLMTISVCDKEFARVDRLLKAVSRSAFQLAKGLRKRANGEVETPTNGKKAKVKSDAKSTQSSQPQPAPVAVADDVSIAAA